MTPITQTREGSSGDCIAACIASILDLPLDKVPDVNGQVFKSIGGPWWVRLDALHSLGYGILVMNVRSLRTICSCPGSLCILLGKSIRGCGHAVVDRITDSIETVMIHDPHWDRTGLVSVEHVVWLITYTKTAIDLNLL